MRAALLAIVAALAALRPPLAVHVLALTLITPGLAPGIGGTARTLDLAILPALLAVEIPGVAIPSALALHPGIRLRTFTCRVAAVLPLRIVPVRARRPRVAAAIIESTGACGCGQLRAAMVY